MAGSLELGKLVTASFLYRHWNITSFLQKIYLTAATILLVIITSTGIFGYLSSAYQQTSLELEKHLLQANYMEEEIVRISEEQDYLLEEMKATVATYPDNYYTAKREVREKYGEQIINLNGALLDLKTDLANLNIKILDAGVEVGPALFLSKSLNLPMDSVVNMLILTLIIVFDPLAVMLVVAYNQLVIERKELN